MSRAKKADEDTMTRRDLAVALGLHPDSVSRNLHRGLAGAVEEWGGRGRETTFSFARALRWLRAWQCRQRNGGHPCRWCSNVLYEMEAVAEHLIESRHGYGGCGECSATWPLVSPCDGNGRPRPSERYDRAALAASHRRGTTTTRRIQS